jgi:hypothetical protein
MKCQCRHICNGGYAGCIATVSVNNGLLVGQGGNDGPPLEEAIANMHLIAASPKLFEALLECMAVLQAHLETNHLRNQTLKALTHGAAAIATARGEDPQ